MRNDLFFSLITFLLSLIFYTSHAQIILVEESNPSYSRIQNNAMYKDVNHLVLEDAMLKYPHPFRKTQFDATQDLPQSRKALRNVIPYTNKKNEPVMVNELCWELDSLFNITVWYKKDSVARKPVLNMVWEKGTEF